MTSNMIFNFCAGPAALPKPVMLKAQEEFLDWGGTGVSVMEISHRSPEYQQLAERSERNLRNLLKISDDYAVLFLQGGGTQQFSNIPMTLLKKGREAEYLSNGVWSSKASKEAEKYGKVNNIDVLHVNEEKTYSISSASCWNRSDLPAYTHFTPNETIGGLRFEALPVSEAPLIADLSSCILSEQINVSDYDLIYAGAQKNIGPAGLTIVIVKRALYSEMDFSQIPAVSNYQEQDKQGSMLNTPPTYSWYLASLVFEWMQESGGVAGMEQQAIEKSELLYHCIDEDGFYRNPVVERNRSRMNIPFILKDNALNDVFLCEAKKAGLVGLEGHRSVGGMRASLYNSMPVAGVKVLIEFMREFKASHG